MPEWSSGAPRNNSRRHVSGAWLGGNSYYLWYKTIAIEKDNKKEDIQKFEANKERQSLRRRWFRWQ